MKKVILTALIITLPLFAEATEVKVDPGSVHAKTPNVTFGSRDSRGYYWDGGDWRDRDYWERHHGPQGEKGYTGHHPQGAPHQAPRPTFGSRDSRGHYWDGGDWRSRDYWERHHGPRGEKHYTGRRPQGVPHQNKKGFCPPGQAKKGNC